MNFNFSSKRLKGSYLVKRSFQVYRDHGLKVLLCSIIQHLAQGYLMFLNRRSTPKSRERYLIKEILGSKMYLDATDEGICRDLITDGIREASCVETMYKELKEGDIVVDIGANIGYYTLLEAKVVGDRDKVYAIEPAPENVELLKRNIELNKYLNVEVCQLAVGDKNGLAPMYLSRKRNLGTLREVSGTEKERFVKKKVDVEVMTLDDFSKSRPYPQIIRMDVEGYEYQIIRGMKRILKKELPLILFIEFHFHLLKREESIEILQALKNAGFEIVDVTSDLAIRGRSRHKLLWNITHRMYSITREELNNKPWGHHLNLSIDDVLKSDILDTKWGALHICFKRN